MRAVLFLEILPSTPRSEAVSFHQGFPTETPTHVVRSFEYIRPHRAVKFGGGARVRRQECTSTAARYRSDKSLLFELFCTTSGQSWDMGLVVGFVSVGFG